MLTSTYVVCRGLYLYRQIDRQIYTCIYIYKYIYTHMYIFYTYTHTHTHTQNTHVYTLHKCNTHSHTHTHTNTHTHTHTHTHTYAHTHVQNKDYFVKLIFKKFVEIFPPKMMMREIAVMIAVMVAVATTTDPANDTGCLVTCILIENCCDLGYKHSIFSQTVNRPKQYKMKKLLQEL